MKKANILQVSFLIACGSALQLAESFIPYPVPGMRIGIANISTVLGMVLFGLPSGLEIAVFRPIITSLTNGSFLSPGFFLSLLGSIGSFTVMAAIYRLTRNYRIFSLIGVSVIGALAHNVTQLAVAYYWLIPHHAVLALAPILLVTGLVGGYFIGWASGYVLGKINESKFSLSKLQDAQAPEQGLVLLDKLKIIAAFSMVIITIFLTTPKSYVILICVVFLFILFSDQPLNLVFKKLVRLWGVVIGSFFLPVLFSPGGTTIFRFWILNITDMGIQQGILFVLRLVFLIFISIWIGVTEPDKLSRELAWLLSPLKVFHVPVDRIPRLTSLSLSFMPLIWEKLNGVRPKRLKGMLDALVLLFIGLE